MKITVIGSSNVDLTARVDHLPLPGETVRDASFVRTLGGKGANQAVAAARLGGEVTFITSLGDDGSAAELRERFRREGIAADHCVCDRERPTGTALILVAESGENCIAVAPGANYALSPEAVGRFTDAVEEADIVVMQAEIPYRTVRTVALLAHAQGKKVLFNPAPACRIDTELMRAIDILVLNQIEASIVTGIRCDGRNLRAIADRLLDEGTRNVVITLGGQGVYLRNRASELRLPAYRVKAVDTVAAGDTFCGALAVRCACGPIDEAALRFANAAAAIAVTRPGAQPSIPTLDEVERFLTRNPIATNPKPNEL